MHTHTGTCMHLYAHMWTQPIRKQNSDILREQHEYKIRNKSTEIYLLIFLEETGWFEGI